MKSDVQLGAWVVAAQKALSKWNADQIVLDPFEAIIVAGRAGELFSATRAMGVVEFGKFDLHRKLAKLKPIVARQVLKEAERLSLVEVTWASPDSTAALERFRFKDNSKEGVLEAVGKLFPCLEPSPIARAALELLGATLDLPSSLDEVRNSLAAKGFLEKDVDLAVRLITELGLLSQTQETEDGTALLFNPYTFEKNAEDVYTALKALAPADRDQALKIVEFVKKNPGVPIRGGTPKKLLGLLVKLGIIDYSKIITRGKQNEGYFPTAPYIWGVFDKAAGAPLSQDLIDDSKL